MAASRGGPGVIPPPLTGGNGPPGLAHTHTHTHTQAHAHTAGGATGQGFAGVTAGATTTAGRGMHPGARTAASGGAPPPGLGFAPGVHTHTHTHAPGGPAATGGAPVHTGGPSGVAATSTGAASSHGPAEVSILSRPGRTATATATSAAAHTSAFSMPPGLHASAGTTGPPGGASVPIDLRSAGKREGADKADARAGVAALGSSYGVDGTGATGSTGSSGGVNGRSGGASGDAAAASSTPMGPDAHGLLGLLTVLRMADRNLTTLAVGTDTSSLSLSLGAPEPLFPGFAHPWGDTPATRDPAFALPAGYRVPPVPLKTGHLTKFDVTTLLYIFHAMPQDVLQAYAAQELFQREWRFHREIKAWFKREGSTWVYWDVSAWERRLYTGSPAALTAGFLAEEEVRVRPSGAQQTNVQPQ